MSFLAGVFSRDGNLSAARKRQFQESLNLMTRSLPWPLERWVGEKSALAQGSFSHMWQGKKLQSDDRMEAVGTGVQWRRISRSSALAYLAENLGSDGPAMENVFDQFQCAVYDKNKRRTVLCTDPMGMAPMYYAVHDDCVAFSSHQTWFRRFLGPEAEVDWQGALEYLVIGHNLGERSLLKGVRVLPPDERLVCNRDNWKTEKCETISIEKPEQGLFSPETAAEAVYDYLKEKCRSYTDMSERPIAGFLSGGWDSRLLVAMFHDAGHMEETYTSQQLVRFGNRVLSEKKIAGEVARFLGVKNRFVAPVYRTRANRNERSCMVDCETWFHDWAYALAEELPRDEYLFCDGLLGDILLRGLSITPDLERYQREQDRDRAAEWFHARYLEGFNTYTRGFGQWSSVIQPSVLEHFSHELMGDISKEIHRIPGQDFVTLFLLRNRSRRGISPLPRFIWGSKGTVVFPFCDIGFLHRVLSIPLSLRLDHSLYQNLLEKCRKGLSRIPSTNTADPKSLASYLVDSVAQLTWQGRIAAGASRIPVVGDVYDKVRTGMVKKDRRKWAQEVVERPPQLLEEILRPEITGIIRGGRLEDLAGYRFFLERMLILEDYFS